MFTKYAYCTSNKSYQKQGLIQIILSWIFKVHAHLRFVDGESIGRLTGSPFESAVNFTGTPEIYAHNHISCNKIPYMYSEPKVDTLRVLNFVFSFNIQNCKI